MSPPLPLPSPPPPVSPCFAFATAPVTPLRPRVHELPGSVGCDADCFGDGSVFMMGYGSEVVLWDAATLHHLRTLQMQHRVTAMVVVPSAAAGEGAAAAAGEGAAAAAVAAAAAGEGAEGGGCGHDADSFARGDGCRVVVAVDGGLGASVAVLQLLHGAHDGGSGGRWGVDDGSLFQPLQDSGGGGGGGAHITCMALGPSCIGCGCRYISECCPCRHPRSLLTPPQRRLLHGHILCRFQASLSRASAGGGRGGGCDVLRKGGGALGSCEVEPVAVMAYSVQYHVLFISSVS
jgi:hypothetical protein